MITTNLYTNVCSRLKSENPLEHLNVFAWILLINYMTDSNYVLLSLKINREACSCGFSDFNLEHTLVYTLVVIIAYFQP